MWYTVKHALYTKLKANDKIKMCKLIFFLKNLRLIKKNGDPLDKPKAIIITDNSMRLNIIAPFLISTQKHMSIFKYSIRNIWIRSIVVILLFFISNNSWISKIWLQKFRIVSTIWCDWMVKNCDAKISEIFFTCYSTEDRKHNATKFLMQYEKYKCLNGGVKRRICMCTCVCHSRVY